MQLWITCDTQLEFPLYILLGANSCAGKLVRFVIYFGAFRLWLQL